MTKSAPPAKTDTPSKTEPLKKEEESSFFGFGFGGTRSRSPSPLPGASSASGKVLGFGSSFLSSASNLISAVQDEPSTTPPTSRKVPPFPKPLPRLPHPLPQEKAQRQLRAPSVFLNHRHWREKCNRNKVKPKTLKKQRQQRKPHLLRPLN